MARTGPSPGAAEVHVELPPGRRAGGGHGQRHGAGRRGAHRGRHAAGAGERAEPGGEATGRRAPGGARG